MTIYAKLSHFVLNSAKKKSNDNIIVELILLILQIKT